MRSPFGQQDVADFGIQANWSDETKRFLEELKQRDPAKYDEYMARVAEQEQQIYSGEAGDGRTSAQEKRTGA